jgi:hypothetical protein
MLQSPGTQRASGEHVSFWPQSPGAAQLEPLSPFPPMPPAVRPLTVTHVALCASQTWFEPQSEES